MKKYLLILCALLLTAVGASAQTITSGTYMLQNVETGYYLGSGATWGTQATIIKQPQQFTLTEANGAYTLESYVYNGANSNKLGTNLYVDGTDAASWTIEQQSNGAYTLYNSTVGYLAGNGKDAAVVGVTSITDATYWNLITKDDIVKSQASATSASPVDVTGLINNPSLNKNSQTSYGTAYWTTTGTVAIGYTNAGGDGVTYGNVAEGYHNNFSMYQTLNNLTPGIYVLSAQGFHRDDDSQSSYSAPVMYVGSELTSNISSITSASGQTSSKSSGQTMADAQQDFLSGLYPISPIEFTVDEDNTSVVFGFRGTDTHEWVIWGDLELMYYGTELNYSIGEPECSATYVQPGSVVTITFPCVSPTEGEQPTLSGSITVNGTTVESTLSYDGFTATVTITIPESIGYGTTVTVAVPAGLLSWTGTEVASPAGEFTLRTPAIVDDDYLIMDKEGYYLGGGLIYGTQASTIGKPQFIGFEVQENGTYHLDSHQYNSSSAHYLGPDLYFDNASPVSWTVAEVDGGYTIYGNGGYLTSNGLQTAASVADDPYVWTLVTKDEVIASMVDATKEAPVDVTALIAAPEMKRNSNSSYYPTWTVTTGSVTFGGGSAVANCAESYHSLFNVQQTITLPSAGTYELSAQGFYRDDSTGDDAPEMYADDEAVAFPVLDTSANNMAEAYQEFLEGIHPLGPITITTTSDNETVTIGFRDDNASEWVIMGELGLLYYGVESETIEWEMTDAGWGTLILPFAADVPTDEETGEPALTLYAGDQLTEDNTTATIVVGTAATSIVANTPYLVSGTKGTYTFTGVATNTADTYTVGLLTGTYKLLEYSDFYDVEAGDGSTVYLLQNHNEEGGEGVAFYPVTSESEGATLTPYHCYLDFTGAPGEPGDGDEPPATSLSIVLPGAGGETGIVAVESELIANDAIYDLSGRKVSKAVKGVYIMNGKKVLVK